MEQSLCPQCRSGQEQPCRSGVPQVCEIEMETLLLKTYEDVSQQRPTKQCCKEENLRGNTLLSLPETKV